MTAIASAFLDLRTFLVLPFAYIAYFLLRGYYRVSWHPLARFPGPKLVALTRWFVPPIVVRAKVEISTRYEVYFEVYRNGKFSEHIEHLHAQYGNIQSLPPL
jgi:hypothetical protein